MAATRAAPSVPGAPAARLRTSTAAAPRLPRVVASSRCLAVRARAAPSGAQEREDPPPLAAALRNVAITAASAALAAGLAAAANAAGLDQVEAVEQELNSSFAVDLGGYAVDHKTLIYGVFVGQWVAVVGAVVGGLVARQRSLEVKELNDKLLETNKAMRKQLNRDVHASRSVEESEVVAEVTQALRQGKGLLKEKRPAEAKAIFERALVSIASAGSELESPWKAERKARRGIAASAIQMKDYQLAEANLLRVVELCETMLPPGTERPELADAYGVLADMYTEAGQLDKAAEVYDKMILEMSSA